MFAGFGGVASKQMKGSSRSLFFRGLLNYCLLLPYKGNIGIVILYFLGGSQLLFASSS